MPVRANRVARVVGCGAFIAACFGAQAPLPGFAAPVAGLPGGGAVAVAPIDAPLRYGCSLDLDFGAAFFVPLVAVGPPVAGGGTAEFPVTMPAPLPFPVPFTVVGIALGAASPYGPSGTQAMDFVVR